MSAPGDPVLPAGVLFGAAYYPEYHLSPRLELDLDLMAAAGFTVIRVGESVWSTWEPRDGVFELDWLEPVLDGARARGIRAVLGTPTYAVPPWLWRRHPEIAAHLSTGRPMSYGARQDVDYSHPTFRWYAERVVRRIVTRYAAHPAVVGYQVDNEPGLRMLHNPAVFASFVEKLRARYGDVERLNDAWGLTFWSHRLSDWADLWVPDGNTTPAYDLAWRRHQADVTSEFIHWQADVVREHARADQFVTTCLSLPRPAQDLVELVRPLDVAAVNIYYRMQDAFGVPGDDSAERAGVMPPGGAVAAAQQSDLSYSLRGERFLVTETNATSVGHSEDTYPAYDGQWRQAAWLMVARGARMVEYWHWHTNHHGHETYWGGVLGHSLEPDRVYREVARLGAEFRTAGATLDGLVPDADVTLLHDHDSAWALQFHPPFGGVETGPWRGPAELVLRRWYRALFEARVPVAMSTPDQLQAELVAAGGDMDVLVERRPVLVAPALYVADDGTLDLLAAYAEAGGHLVLGFRTGYADPLGRPRVTVQPGKLRRVAGVRYTEFSNLDLAVPVAPGAGQRGVTGSATRWADALEPEGAETLALYDHPHFRRWPAVTTHSTGPGRVTTVGTLPDAELAAALVRFLTPARTAADGWRTAVADHPTVTAFGARVDAGRLRVVHNWSWTPATPLLPVAVEDVVGGGTLPAGAVLELGPWDVRVLLERSGEGRP